MAETPKTAKRIWKKYTEKPYKGIAGSFALMIGDDCKFVVMRPVSSPTRYEAPTPANTKLCYKGEQLEEDIDMQQYVKLLEAKAKASA